MEPATLRKLVWEEMLFADMRANYFAELLRNYQARDKFLRVAVLIASSGAVGTTLAQLDAPAKITVPVIAAAGSFWLLISQYSSLARDAADLHAGWSGVAKDYERLWNHLEDADAEANYQQIYDRGESLSRVGSKFPNKPERLAYWLDQAAALAVARYA
jgi:hypothetical protein